MLDDRATSVDSIKTIAEQLIDQSEEPERSQIEQQLSEVESRWDKLSKAAADRKKALEDTVGVAKEYHDVLEPFLEWLDKTEKKMAAVDAIGSDAEKIEKQMEEHEVRTIFFSLTDVFFHFI